MLLLWLSIVCMIPFDMARLDSNIRSQTGEVKKPVMERIVDIGKVNCVGKLVKFCLFAVFLSIPKKNT